jgi:histidine ammonia-lyase
MNNSQRSGSQISRKSRTKPDGSGQSALNRLGLERLELLPKKGLVMINGASVMTAMAAVSMGAHALFIRGLRGTN